jgi:hypothetical protein
MLHDPRMEKKRSSCLCHTHRESRDDTRRANSTTIRWEAAAAMTSLFQSVESPPDREGARQAPSKSNKWKGLGTNYAAHVTRLWPRVSMPTSDAQRVFSWLDGVRSTRPRPTYIVLLTASISDRPGSKSCRPRLALVRNDSYFDTGACTTSSAERSNGSRTGCTKLKSCTKSPFIPTKKSRSWATSRLYTG